MEHGEERQRAPSVFVTLGNGRQLDIRAHQRTYDGSYMRASIAVMIFGMSYSLSLPVVCSSALLLTLLYSYNDNKGLFKGVPADCYGVHGIRVSDLCYFNP